MPANVTMVLSISGGPFYGDVEANDAWDAQIHDSLREQTLECERMRLQQRKQA